MVKSYVIMKNVDNAAKLDSLKLNFLYKILTCSILFGLYAFYLLIEVFDFLALLHSKEPDYNATYSIIHVTYFIVEMIICIVLAIWIYLIYISQKENYIRYSIIFTTIAIFRIILVYYLYHYSNPQYHFVPYIYKLANPLSNVFRFSFIYLQIIAVVVCAFTSFKIARISRRLDL